MSHDILLCLSGVFVHKQLLYGFVALTNAISSLCGLCTVSSMNIRMMHYAVSLVLSVFGFPSILGPFWINLFAPGTEASTDIGNHPLALTIYS